MGEWKKRKTTPKVWSAIRAAHSEELKVFSSFSAPDGDYFGNPSEGRMLTEYGFDGADYPLIGAETRWDIDRENPSNRENEHHEYWLCVPVED